MVIHLFEIVRRVNQFAHKFSDVICLQMLCPLFIYIKQLLHTNMVTSYVWRYYISPSYTYTKQVLHTNLVTSYVYRFKVLNIHKAAFANIFGDVMCLHILSSIYTSNSFCTQIWWCHKSKDTQLKSCLMYMTLDIWRHQHCVQKLPDVYKRFHMSKDTKMTLDIWRHQHCVQ